MKFLLVVLSYCVFAGVLAQECGDNRFQCDDGYCIPQDLVCDGEMNCIDGSDEAASLNCSEIPCDGFRCNDTGRCIPESWICDYENDCRDGSDEIDCACDGFQCADGSCIPSSWECDNEFDCDDGSDEIGCVCDGFQCDNGQCIPPSWECDGEADCSDNTDERECPCPNPDDFKCESDGQCIPSEYVCDEGSIQDCADNSDEAPELCGRSAGKGQKRTRKMQSLFLKEIQPARAQLRQRHDKIKSRYGKH